MIEFHFTFDRGSGAGSSRVALPQEVRYLRDLIDQNLIALGKEQKALVHMGMQCAPLSAIPFAQK